MVSTGRVFASWRWRHPSSRRSAVQWTRPTLTSTHQTWTACRQTTCPAGMPTSKSTNSTFFFLSLFINFFFCFTHIEKKKKDTTHTHTHTPSLEIILSLINFFCSLLRSNEIEAAYVQSQSTVDFQVDLKNHFFSLQFLFFSTFFPLHSPVCPPSYYSNRLRLWISWLSSYKHQHPYSSKKTTTNVDRWIDNRPFSFYFWSSIPLFVAKRKRKTRKQRKTAKQSWKRLEKLS